MRLAIQLAQQTTYLVVKVIQFAFPLVWVLLVLRESLQLRKPNASGLVLGAAFSLAVVGAGWLLFDFVLRDTPAFAAAAPKIRDKIAQFGIDSLWKYAALGLFYSARPFAVGGILLALVRISPAAQPRAALAGDSRFGLGIHGAPCDFA